VRLQHDRHVHLAVAISIPTPPTHFKLTTALVLALGAAGSGLLTLVPSAAACLVCSVSSAGPALLANLAPGQTATGASSLSLLDTLSSSWTLQAQDSGSGAGHMVAGGTGCTGSSATLTNPLKVLVTPTGSLLGHATSAGQISLTSSAQTVATGTAAILSTATLDTGYTQVIPSAQRMLTGCSYSLTVTYTLQ
jgi:hypothetical protein